MTRPPKINLEKLVPRIVLDIDLLNHFASHGRRVAALAAIELARKAGRHPALDFLEWHVGRWPSGT